MNESICPEKLHPWYPNTALLLDVKSCYDGGDAWLGAFKHNESHSGLDINVPNNTPVWAPINFDQQYYFMSIAKGDNNNRWMGEKTWPNGEKWTLRSHHMTDLYVKEHTPLSKGTPYGTIGGTHFGSHTHAHFNFIWKKDSMEMHLDPWIIFWQIFKQMRKDQHRLSAIQKPIQNLKTNQPALFNGSLSEKGILGNSMKYLWIYSDGARYEGPEVKRTFKTAGIHWATLICSNGSEKSECTQYFTVHGPSGKGLKKPDLKAKVWAHWPERINHETDIYALSNSYFPQIQFYYRKNEPSPTLKRTIVLSKQKEKQLNWSASIVYEHGQQWLKTTNKADSIEFEFQIDQISKATGEYRAVCYILGQKNDTLDRIYIQANCPDHTFLPKDSVVVCASDAIPFPSAFEWIKNPYNYAMTTNAYNDFYIWSGISNKGKIRYQPDLKSGTYKIQVANHAFFNPAFITEKKGVFKIKVKTPSGIIERTWDPEKTNELGTYDWLPFKESYIELEVEGNDVFVVDALLFLRQNP